MADIFEIVGKVSLDGLDKAENDLKGFSKTGEQSSSAFGSAIGKLGTAIAGVFATQKIIGFGKDVIATTQNFSDAMLKVQSLSGATGDELQKLNDTALKYGSTTAWTSSQVADAMGYMALAGFNTNEIMDSLSGTLGLASASGTDLAVASDILTDALTAFGYEAKDAGLFADVLATTQAKSNTTVEMLGEAFKYVAPLAGTYGYEVESVSTALGMMANAGIKGSMAGTSMASIITRLATNTNGAREQIEALGIEFYNSDGTARDLSDVLMELSDATSKMTAEEKASVAQKVAGQEAQKGLLAVLNQGSGAYRELNDTLKQCGGTASEMSGTMESGIGGAIRTMESAIEGFKIKIGQKFEPYIATALQSLATFVTEKLVPNVESFIDKLSELKTWAEEHKTLITVITSLLEVLTGAFIAFKAGAMIQSVVQGFQSAKVTLALFKMETQGASVAQGLLNGQLTIGETIVALLTGKMTLAELATALWAKAQGVLNAVMSANPIALVVMAIGALIAIVVVAYKKSETFRNFINDLWEGLKKFASWIADGFVSAWNGIVEFFTVTIPNVFNNVIDFIKNNWQGLLLMIVNPFVGAFKLLYDNCEGFKNFVNKFVENIKNFFKELPGKIAYWLGFAIGTVAKFVVELPAKAKEAGQNFLDNIVAFFTQLPDKIATWFTNTTNKVSEFGTNLKNKAVEIGTNFVNSIVNFFAELPGRLKNWLNNTINNVVNFASNMATKAKEAGTHFVNNIVNTLKNLPSKVVNIGKSVVEGIWNGITGAGKWLKDKISGFASNIVKGFKDSFKINSPAKVMYPIGEGIDEGVGVSLENSDASENAVQSKFGSIINTAGNAFGEVQSFISNKANELGNIDTSVPDFEFAVNSNISNEVENPIQKYKVAFDAQFNSLNDGFDRLLALIGQYLPNIADNMDRNIVLDGNSLVVGMSRRIDAQLGKISTAKGRGNV